jgi:DNA modification methylase
MINHIHQGQVIEGLQQMPDKIAHTCVTSPPYYGLRDYGVEGQIGLEETPEMFIEKLVEVFREVRRVLRDDGTVWINMGDSYSGSRKGYGTDPEYNKIGEKRMREELGMFNQ